MEVELAGIICSFNALGTAAWKFKLLNDCELVLLKVVFKVTASPWSFLEATIEILNPLCSNTVYGPLEEEVAKAGEDIEGDDAKVLDGIAGDPESEGAFWEGIEGEGAAAGNEVPLRLPSPPRSPNRAGGFAAEIVEVGAAAIGGAAPKMSPRRSKVPPLPDAAGFDKGAEPPPMEMPPKRSARG